MQVPAILKNALSLFLLPVAVCGNSQACEKPVLSKNVSLEAMSASGFRLAWNPISNARHYELKYSLRIPEGRTLMQSEVIAATPFHVFPAEELRQADVLQLIVEITTQCEAANSAPAFAQISLKNPAPECRFENQLPALTKNELAWAPVKSAQSYVMCFHKQGNQTVCQETVSTRNTINSEKTPLIGVTPVCNNLPGTPVFISSAAHIPGRYFP